MKVHCWSIWDTSWIWQYDTFSPAPWQEQKTQTWIQTEGTHGLGERIRPIQYVNYSEKCVSIVIVYKNFYLNRNEDVKHYYKDIQRRIQRSFPLIWILKDWGVIQGDWHIAGYSILDRRKENNKNIYYMPTLYQFSYYIFSGMKSNLNS